MEYPTRENLCSQGMYGRPRVNLKVEPRSTFTFIHGLSHIGSILLTSVNYIVLACARKYYATSAVEIHRNCS